MLNIIRLVYIKVKETKLNIQNDTYQDTIIGGIQGFLKIYNPDFKAQDMKITADYPVYNNLIGKLVGVEFIKEYLNSIYLENLFCKKFSEEKIKYLLYGYSHDYKELIINIFEIVLLEVNLKDETVWLNLEQMAELFKRDKSVISRHIKNALVEELKDEQVIAKFATTTRHGAIEGKTQKH